MIELELEDHTGSLTPSQVGFLREKATVAATVMGLRGFVSISMLRDAGMARAHEKHSGIAGTTDVLTFDLSPRRPIQVGERSLQISSTCSIEVRYSTLIETEILVCSDEATRQASQRNHGVEREVLLYIIHGLLHCLGFDDHDEQAATEMHRMEDAILTAIGVGPVYRDV